VVNPGVSASLAVIEGKDEPVRGALLRLRELVLQTANETAKAGTLVETLKWGQPSFLTDRPKSGTTIRIDRDRSDLGDIALYVPCSTSLVSEWRGMFPSLTYGGDRSVHFAADKPLPEDALRQMIAMALTYHIRKARR